MKPIAQRIVLNDGVHTLDWLLTTRAGQELLKATHGSARRPRCMCVAGGVEMYVGRRGERFYLSRMPGTGFLHAESCESVEDGTLLSGAHCYAPGVLVERADGMMLATADLERRERTEQPATAMGIDGVLDLLMEQSALNQLATGAAPRTWGLVRERLQEAAATILIDGRPLADSLFLPEPYERDRGAEMLLASEQFISSHTGHALVCAPLKEVRPTQYGWQLVLKHLPRLKLWLSKEHAAAIEGRVGLSWVSAPPKFALCLVMAKPGRRDGNFTVPNMALLATDANFFPCRGDAEAAIAAELHQAGNDLVRPLRFDSGLDQAVADFGILAGNTVEPVFVLASSGNEILDSAKRALAGVLQRNGAKAKIYPT